MAEKWTPDGELAKLIAYANDGIQRSVLSAILLKIALDGSNQMAAIKAVETLLTMGTEGAGDAGYDPQTVMRLAQLIDKALMDGDLYAVLGDIGLGIDETETADFEGDVSRLVPGIRKS